jgi:hypothetical protein
MTVPFNPSKAWAAKIAKADKMWMSDGLPREQIARLRDAEAVEYLERHLQGWIKQGTDTRKALAEKIAANPHDAMYAISWVVGKTEDIAREKLATDLLKVVKKTGVTELFRKAAVYRLAIMGMRDTLIRGTKYPANRSSSPSSNMAEDAERAAIADFLGYARALGEDRE